jgi:hypothetical protein
VSLALRMQAQLLAGPPARDVLSAVTRVVGIQAQSPGPARLAVRARTSGLTAADVDRAGATGVVVRTWLMRGTLHMVSASDVRWMVALLGPVFLKSGRRRRLQLGLDDALCERSLPLFSSVLAEGEPLTRAELVTRLDLGLDLKSQQPAHLIGYAALSGLICRGPDGPGNEPTYVLLDSWAPGSPRADGLAELARRYLAGYGPATAADFAAWSGLPAADARTAFASLSADDPEPPPEMPPRLVGHWDTYLLGYQSRDLVLDRSHARKIQAGGFIQPAVLVDGRVAGTWRLDRRRLTVEPFSSFRKRDLAALRAEADDIARFLDTPITFATA